MTPLPAFARGLYDDAAVFPPGLTPLGDATRTHRAHRASAYRELVRAGLHHAIRNTDPRTGFDQHGFLNLLLTTDAALAGSSKDQLIGVLGERGKDTLADAVRGLDDDRATAVRRRFVSFGTCSITEPLNELVELGLVTEPAASGEGATP